MIEGMTKTQRRRAEGFTLIEVMAALAILGAATFLLLQTHFSTLNLFADAQESATAALVLDQVVGLVEAKVFEGKNSGGDDMGAAYPQYGYTYSTQEVDSEVPGLLKVTLTISGPEEDRIVIFIVYDGVQIDVSG